MKEDQAKKVKKFVKKEPQQIKNGYQLLDGPDKFSYYRTKIEAAKILYGRAREVRL